MPPVSGRNSIALCLQDTPVFSLPLYRYSFGHGWVQCVSILTPQMPLSLFLRKPKPIQVVLFFCLETQATFEFPPALGPCHQLHLTLWAWPLKHSSIQCSLKRDWPGKTALSP